MFYNVFAGRKQMFQWCPVYLRSGIHVMNNPSGTSCMSILMFHANFANHRSRPLYFTMCVCYFDLGDFEDVPSTFAIAMLSQIALPWLRACRFSFSHRKVANRCLRPLCFTMFFVSSTVMFSINPSMTSRMSTFICSSEFVSCENEFWGRLS